MSDLPTGGPDPLDLPDSTIDEHLPDPNDPDFEEPPEPEEGEGEPEPQPPAEGAELQQRRSRPGEAARWRQRYDDLARDVAELRRQTQAPAQPQQPYVDPLAQQRAQQEWFAQLAQIDPAQAYAQMWAAAEQRMSNGLMQNRMELQERIDKQAYDLAVATSQHHRHYQPEVERLVREARARFDYTTTREQVLQMLVGRDALTRARNGAPAQRRQAAARVASQTVRPAAARSDVAPTQSGRRVTNQDADDEALLRRLTTDDI